MKKLCLAFAVLALIVLVLPIATVSVSAAENEISVEEVSETETESKINEILAKLKENEDLQWFKTYVIPALSGAGAGIISFILALFPSIKKKNEYNKLLAAYKNVKAAYEDLEKNTSVETIKKHIELILGDEIKARFEELIKKVEIDKNTIAETNAEIKSTYNAVVALIEAAKVTWRGSPTAVELLSGSPTAETVKATESENIKLKEYIAKIGGEDKVNEALKG